MPAEEREPVPGASRRRLLAVALALAVMPTTARAAGGHHDDAELISLGCRIDDLRQAICLAREEAIQLQDAWETGGPERPEELRKRPCGMEVDGWGNSGLTTGDGFYGSEDVRRAQENLPWLERRAALGDEHARSAAARAREVIKADADWRLAVEAARVSVGVDDGWLKVDALRASTSALAVRALKLRAGSREALLVKAQLVHWHSPLNHEGDPDQDEPEWAAFASLLADLQAGA